jgi:hypothetical protein
MNPFEDPQPAASDSAQCDPVLPVGRNASLELGLESLTILGMKMDGPSIRYMRADGTLQMKVS